jgi:DNA-binding MarR family transcriptional regulator
MTRSHDSESFSVDQHPSVRGENHRSGWGDSADQPLGYLLYRAMTTLRPYMVAELQPLGIGVPEFVCMRILAGAPGQSNASLARSANVSPQAMNLVVRTLQDMGVVARPAVATGRSIPARLTGKGMALLQRAEAVMGIADERLMVHLSSAERARFKRFLHSMGAHDPFGRGVNSPSSE